MRFLVFMIPAVYPPKNGKKTDPDFAPDAEMMAKMGKFNAAGRRLDEALPGAGRRRDRNSAGL